VIDLPGRIAVVTGASSGLGRRIALDLAHAGATVVGVARRENALRQLAGEMREVSPDSGFTPCDVSDVDAYRALLAVVEEERGRIDLLVQAAGWEQRTRVEDADLDLYRSIMETNFFAVVAGTLAVVPGMLERHFGVVVNVSSDHGRAPAPGTPAYSASKAGLSAFTESVAHEVADRGVRLHILYPGWVPTPMGQGVVEAGMKPPPRIVRRTEEQVSRAVLKTMGTPAIDINVARIATLAPVMRSLAPPLYRRSMRAQG
jgi:NAD(P)-dependent dehydrogenase (short-subunit alcohol dehydrogenase family)